MKWEEGMGFASLAFFAECTVPLARSVSAPADRVVLCNSCCPANLFTVLGLCGELFSLLVVFDLVSSSNQCEKHAPSLT